MRRATIALLSVALLAGAWLAVGSPARSDTRSDKALLDAVARGKTLYQTPFAPGAKACAACHGPGPNKMIASRLKAWPQWDKVAQKVISGQQKINQMIETKAGGQALPLGSDDLNALEAYLSTLR